MISSIQARRAVEQVICTTRLDRAARPLYGGHGSILALHRVLPVADGPGWWSAAVTITPGFLHGAITRLLARGYEFVTMSQALHRLRTGRGGGRRFICLTFDDGSADNFDHAFPVCRALGVPMVVYVTSGFLARTDLMWWLGLERVVSRASSVRLTVAGHAFDLASETPMEKRACYGRIAHLLSTFPPLQIRETCGELATRYGVDFAALTDAATLRPAAVRAMAESGLVEFGAHGVSHANLAQLDAADAAREVAESCGAVAGASGAKVRHFAFPYGHAAAAGWREFELCRRAGLESAVTTRMGNLFPVHRNTPFALPRLNLHGEHQTFGAVDALVSGVLPAIRHGLRRTATT